MKMSDDYNHSNQSTLKDIVATMIEHYITTLEGQPAQNLHAFVIKEVELGLFKTVLKHTGGNQSLAAQWLGLARGTLRKRLCEYNLE
jgi:Fis family transcriptional regulator